MLRVWVVLINQAISLLLMIAFSVCFFLAMFGVISFVTWKEALVFALLSSLQTGSDHHKFGEAFDEVKRKR